MKIYIRCIIKTIHFLILNSLDKCIIIYYLLYNNNVKSGEKTNRKEKKKLYVWLW